LLRRLRRRCRHSRSSLPGFGDAGCLAGFQLRFLDRTRSVGDIDRVRADALAEFLEAGAGAAGFNDRGLEVREGFAERFGNDLCIRQNGRGTGNLDLVASNSRACKSGGCSQCGDSKFKRRSSEYSRAYGLVCGA
jgi:hypothetical protein